MPFVDAQLRAVSSKVNEGLQTTPAFTVGPERNPVQQTFDVKAPNKKMW